MTYIKTLNPPDIMTSTEKKWHDIMSENISEQEKSTKWKSYLTELKKIGTIDDEIEYYLLSIYTF